MVFSAPVCTYILYSSGTNIILKDFIGKQVQSTSYNLSYMYNS